MSAVGELDLATRGRLRAAVDEALLRAAPVELDLRDVTFIDSTGLQTLLELDVAAADGTAGGPLAILASREVRRVLQLTGLDGRLPVRDAS